MKPPVFTSGNAAFKKALNSVVEFAKVHGLNPGGMPGWSQSADGWRPPSIPPSVIAAGLLWELSIEDADAAQVSIKCGKILKDASNLSETFTISNAETIFSVAAGDKLFLKVTNLATPSITLTKASTWTDYPSRYEVTGTEGSAAFSAYHYPLYYFDAVNDAAAITVQADSLYAHRVCENTHFELIYAVYQKDTDAALTVPKLIASHGPLPPT